MDTEEEGILGEDKFAFAYEYQKIMNSSYLLLFEVRQYMCSLLNEAIMNNVVLTGIIWRPILLFLSKSIVKHLGLLYYLCLQ